jgi:flagellar biosynthesis/type III secretory pathway M-ring protein FliF/YscJ
MAQWQDGLGQVLSRLRDLTLSQKLAIGLGAALVALSLVWMAQWAAQPEMIALLPTQDLSADELGQVSAGLDALGVAHRVSGSRILVSASENRAGLLARLGLNDNLPKDTSIGFDGLVKEANPWISQEENNKRWTVAQQNMLAAALRGLTGVRDARVFLNINTQRRGFSRSEAPASASVMLVTRSGEPVSRSLALTAARLVSGAVRGLPLRNVEVLDASGTVALEWDAEESGGGVLERRAREHERRLSEAIKAQIAFDAAARVSVRVELDPTARESEVRTPLEGVETRVSTRSEETSRGMGSEPPGVQPNVGASVGAGRSAERTTRTDNDTELVPGLERTQTRTAAGEVREIFAAINISRSALVGIYRRSNPDAEAPTDEQIEAVFAVQAAKVVSQVQKLVKPQDPNQVAVAWYHDDPIGPVEGTGEAPALAMELIQRFGATSGLALLALAALGMMFRMSRGATSGEAFGIEIGLPREAVAAAQRAAEDARVAARRQPERSGTAAGAASSMGGEVPLAAIPVLSAADPVLLEGQEVDEGAVQVRQMIEQVVRVAEQDPEGIATLIAKLIDQPTRK